MRDWGGILEVNPNGLLDVLIYSNNLIMFICEIFPYIIYFHMYNIYYVYLEGEEGIAFRILVRAND